VVPMLELLGQEGRSIMLPAGETGGWDRIRILRHGGAALRQRAGGALAPRLCPAERLVDLMRAWPPKGPCNSPPCLPGGPVSPAWPIARYRNSGQPPEPHFTHVCGGDRNGIDSSSRLIKNRSTT